MVNRTILNKIIKKNSLNYNLAKAAEEMQELGLVLNQKILKPTKVDNQEIIDEIGDVIIRLEILKKLYPRDAIKKRVGYKMAKYEEYLKTNKYENI